MIDFRARFWFGLARISDDVDKWQKRQSVQNFAGIEAGGCHCCAGSEGAAALEGFAGALEGVGRLEAGDEFFVAPVLERHNGVSVCLGQGDVGVGEEGDLGESRCDDPVVGSRSERLGIVGANRDGGADALTVINTCQGMAVDWRRRRPLLGNVIGGLSGPAIKPIALRCVHQVRQAVEIPIIGVGGIMTIDDCMEFFVTGASAVQIGTANFAEPIVSIRLLEALPAAISELGATSLADVVGTLVTPARAACPPPSPEGASHAE